MLRKVHSLFTDLLDSIIAILLVVITLLVLSQVFCRYVLNNPLSWSEELTRYLIIWLTFLGASLAVRRKGHIAITVLVRFLPQAFQRLAYIVIDILIVVFLLVLVWQGSKVVSVTMIFKSTSLSLPQGYIFLSLPVGAAIMIYYKIIRFGQREKDS